MDESNMDPERIAALLDGRLSDRERAEVLERLAASDVDFEIFADAAAVTREVEAEERTEEVAPPLPIRRWRGWPLLALAAALAAVAIGIRSWPSLRPAPTGDPARLVALLEAEEAGFPAGWDARPWSGARAGSEALSPESRAVRLGARLVDLEVAVRSDDPAASRLAAEIAFLLEGIPGAGPIAARYRQMAEGPDSEREALLEEGGDAVARIADRDHFALGAWAEAARLAAARGDEAFFRARESRGALERIAETPSLPGAAREAAGRIEASLQMEPPDWATVGDELTRLLRATGS